MALPYTLLTIARSQENEKNKMMAEAEAPKLKLSRSREELLKIKGSCLKFLLYSLRHWKMSILVNQKQENLKRIRHK